MRTLLLVTAGCMAAGILSRGIPGVAFMALASPILRFLYGRGWLTELGERARRVAKGVSLLWPLSIVPAIRLAPRLGPIPSVIAPALIVGWGVLAAVVLVAWTRATVNPGARPQG